STTKSPHTLPRATPSTAQSTDFTAAVDKHRASLVSTDMFRFTSIDSSEIMYAWVFQKVSVLNFRPRCGRISMMGRFRHGLRSRSGGTKGVGKLILLER